VSTTQSNPMPVLSHHLRQERAAHPGLTEELGALLVEIGLAGKIIGREVTRAALTGRLGYTGEVNVQGERVKQLDRWANEAMVDVLTRSGLVCTMVSEEMDKPLHLDTVCGASRYLVCFDPVDGSSNTDINGIVGTIFGIRPSGGGSGPSHTTDALGRGTGQVAAGYVMYGPATVLVYTAGHGVHGLTLDSLTGEYVLTHPDLRIPPRGKTYSVNEGNWHRWSSAPRDFIASLAGVTDGARPYSLRYVGSLVADFHRTLLEGGIYLYPAEVGSGRSTGKLRLLYEAAPLALVAEAAGGRASTGTERILEVVASDYHQRVPLLIGSAEEVARAESFHVKEQA
jgi:fructose-1,6-bisphosphatase I